MAAALAHTELLDEIVDFDSHLYRTPWADYENAKIGKLHIMPAEHNRATLESDYAKMQGMFFDPSATPKWAEIMDFIQKLENIINNKGE
jgi:hypothetical protein